MTRPQTEAAQTKSAETETDTAAKWVYSFGRARTDGRADLRNLLGGKGANLAEMSSLGLPVPPGFTITTDACTFYYKNDHDYPADLKNQLRDALALIEDEMDARFGDKENPLLVSVRSGARVSMPGMMDTVLNLGLNDITVEGLAKRSGDRRFAYDSYRRFIQMYGDVVLGLEHHDFEDIIESYKRDMDYTLDTEIDADGWAEIVDEFKALVEERLGTPFPQEPEEQLWGAIGAVFSSWMTPRAVTYRRIHEIPEDWGTAVNVQAMVFGNMGDDCATGVAFTRNPSTGANDFYGEYLVNAQGEDVVAGIRTPQHITLKDKKESKSDLPAMEEVMPEVCAELMKVRDKLEEHYRDMQDVEFTVQQGKLFMLQTRTGKRTAAAALQIAVDMVKEGLISEEEAVLRVDPAALDQLLHPTLDPAAERKVLTTGLPASPGAASGTAVFTADDAEALAQKGEKVILCRIETSPEDIHGMHAAQGIMTSRGGMTSHAAVVARGMGRPCVAGAGDVQIDYAAQQMDINGTVIKHGDTITLDGTTGEIMLGEIPTVKPEMSGNFATLMGWADKCRRMGVRANAETPEDARTARDFGAEGIGLCRTEHMFFDAARIARVREMILADDADGRKEALAYLEPEQKKDFSELFRIMKGLPVTIRLLDPPLHEFLPHSDEEISDLASTIGLEEETIRFRLAQLKESNPMLGHRGCRLGITFPEIYEMQARAIFLAASEVQKDDGETVIPEVMIPLIATRRELDILKEVVDNAAKAVAEETGVSIAYHVGTMIELPRAALQAGDIANSADFFSFGTNDLTQTTLGISRDDAGKFLTEYQQKGILEHDPFVTLDTAGVGQLVEMGVERGRKTRPGLKTGICGEHGGDPKSIAFCEKTGLDYVSCSPYRVPIARLAAAQSALKAAGQAAR